MSPPKPDDVCPRKLPTATRTRTSPRGSNAVCINLDTDADRSPAAALSASGGLRPARGLRHPRRPGRGAGKIRYYGVSVETVDEALARHPPSARANGADHLQHVPAEAGRRVLQRGRGAAASASSRACRSRAACSPASCGAIRCSSADDHRHFNRHGEAFDKGETFSGVP